MPPSASASGVRSDLRVGSLPSSRPLTSLVSVRFTADGRTDGRPKLRVFSSFFLPLLSSPLLPKRMASKVSHLLISHKVNRFPLTGGRARASLPPYIVHPLSRHPPPTFNVVLAGMPLITLRIKWGKSAFENIFEAKTSQSQNDNFPATKVVYVTVKRTARKGVPAHGPFHAHEPIVVMEGRKEALLFVLPQSRLHCSACPVVI